LCVFEVAGSNLNFSQKKVWRQDNFSAAVSSAEFVDRLLTRLVNLRPDEESYRKLETENTFNLEITVFD
jgi:hypothetical protein